MNRLYPLLAFALFTFTVGCSDDDDSSGTGALRVKLTDAPYPYSSISSANITIESVEIRMDDGFHTLAVDGAPVSLNLLDLQNGITEVLVDTEVPVGTIDQIRLIVIDASVTLTDNRVFDLTVPSGESSGLKVFVSPDVQVVDQLTTELLLDFDVSESFEPIPNSATQASEISSFHFHPVLRVANVSETGTLSGHVWSDQGTPGVTSDDIWLVGATVTAEASGLAEGNTASDAQGFFSISGLSPGTHVLRAEVSGYSPADLQATVVAGNERTGNEIRLAPLEGD